MRLSVGAINVETGDLAYFDSREMTIGPEHVMAIGALPPGFPPIEIDGQQYWDGLRGTKPADIPVEQPTKFDLVINLTTANCRKSSWV